MSPRNTFAVELGRRLRRAREEMGLTPEDAATQLDVSASSYRNWERGDRTFPIEKLSSLPELLGRPIDYFLEGEEDSRLKKDELVLLYTYRKIQDGRLRKIVLQSALSAAMVDEEA